MIDRVAEILARTYGPDAPAAIACRVSQPDELILRTTVGSLESTVKEKGIRKQALIIVGRALSPELQAGTQSRLYAPDFSHEFRTQLL
jgi:precorrin-4/cobalt-precorrin-4 C11-methyltransferase